LPQERARLDLGMEGLAAAKRSIIWLGGIEIRWSRWESAGGMATEWKALRASVKKASGERPEQVPCVRHS